MKKIISFMHISLDGFVAGPNGEMNWIHVDEEIFEHVGRRISETDTAMYGRVTYDMMESYWPTAGEQPDASRHDKDHAKWYKTAQKIVLSDTMIGTDTAGTTVISGDLSAHIQEIRRQPGSEILVFGSPSATHALMRENLIDGYWLFVNPVILGRGIPLFSGIEDKINLKLLTTKQFGSGVMELSYEVERK
ncbi:MAG: dihydrofolate reductase family protein [Mucilaginibacter polytrichastri]|nr:dihydrofolate reductase family protein [Mucilaginibacter polytrichastri]